MDGFSDLNLFALVARHRNLAAAARELGVTPPAVSKRLAQLERRLGVRQDSRPQIFVGADVADLRLPGR